LQLNLPQRKYSISLFNTVFASDKRSALLRVIFLTARAGV